MSEKLKCKKCGREDSPDGFVLILDHPELGVAWLCEKCAREVMSEGNES